MEIPLQAHVECSDGVCGISVYVLVDPIIDQVTNLVVRMDEAPKTEYLVPIETISTTIADTIRLKCSKAELEQMKPFVETQFIESKMIIGNPEFAGGAYGLGTYFYSPYTTPEVTVRVPVEHLQIPAGELAIQRGTRVKAKDGYVGTVDEFVVNPKNGYITYVVMREGHLWGSKNVLIPLSAMDDTSKDTLFLNIDKQQIESLPTFPVNRLWS